MKYIISKHWDNNYGKYWYVAHKGIRANLGFLDLYNSIVATLSFSEEECKLKLESLELHGKYKKISEIEIK